MPNTAVFHNSTVSGKILSDGDYASQSGNLYSTMHVGEIIRRLRRSKELSQESLAEMMGLSVSYISKIENGGSDPDTELLKKFATALGVPPAEFFEDGIHEPRPVYSDLKRQELIRFSMPGHISQRERERIEELLQNLSALPADEKELVYDIIDTIFHRRKKG